MKFSSILYNTLARGFSTVMLLLRISEVTLSKRSPPNTFTLGEIRQSAWVKAPKILDFWFTAKIRGFTRFSDILSC